MAYIPVCTRPKTTRLKLDINCFLCTNKLSVLNEAIRHYMRLSSRIFYLLRKFHILHPHRHLRDPGRHPRDLPRQQVKTSVVTAAITIPQKPQEMAYLNKEPRTEKKNPNMPLRILDISNSYTQRIKSSILKPTKCSVT